MVFNLQGNTYLIKRINGNIKDVLTSNAMNRI